MTHLTAERVRELFNYSPSSGEMTRRVRLSKRTRVGDVIGYLGNHGYLAASVDRKQYLVHRLVYLWWYGRWPENQIDHINHDRTDNCINNLRDVSHRQNAVNQKLQENNTSGRCGVYWNKKISKWQAYITVNRKAIYLGIFSNIKDAVSARDSADVTFNFHENHGSVQT